MESNAVWTPFELSAGLRTTVCLVLPPEPNKLLHPNLVIRVKVLIIACRMAECNPPRTSLCPGYKHVSTFSPGLSSPKSKSKSGTTSLPPESTGNGETRQAVTEEGDVNLHDEENESEDEEEVEYVTLDLGNIEPTLVPSSHTYRLIVCLSSLCKNWRCELMNVVGP